MKRHLAAVAAALLCLSTPAAFAEKPAQAPHAAKLHPTKAQSAKADKAAGTGSTTHRAELKEIHGRIESLRRDLSNSEATQSNVSDQLRDTETAISATNRRLHELGERRDELDQDIKNLEAQSTRLSGQIGTQQKQLQALLYRRFLHGENDALQLLLSGEDPARIAQDQYFLTRLSQAKAQLLTQLRDARNEKQRLADARRDKAAELAEVEKDQQQSRNALLQKQKERQAVLARIGDQIKSQRKEIDVLRANEQRLASLIETLARAERERQRAAAKAVKPAPATRTKNEPDQLTRAERAMPSPAPGPTLRNETTPDAGPPSSLSSGSFAALRGRLRLPVKGEIAGRFGTPRADTGATWKGLFIRSGEGNEVHAVAAGRVVFADWLRGFGNLIIVDHGDGYLSIYGNNQSLFRNAGQNVKSGDTIAAVGSSGGQGESGLYFELRLQGQAFDPLKWASLR